LKCECLKSNNEKQYNFRNNTFSEINKAIVDSRLRPQWCFHLANVTEMEEMLDCKLDALIRAFALEKKRFSCQHKSARIT